MKSPKLQKQRTIKVNGETIKIIARRKTSQANFIGWNIFINGIKFFSHVLLMNSAMDSAFAKYVKQLPEEKFNKIQKASIDYDEQHKRECDDNIMRPQKEF